ncbi:MAG: hypothetical protein V1862_10245 [Methanobacteriota archaeon]
MNRQIISTIELLIAAFIIVFTFVQVMNPGNSPDIVIWLGVLAAVTLIIHLLKQRADPRIPFIAILCGLALIATGVFPAVAAGIFGLPTIQPMTMTGLITTGIILITLAIRMRTSGEDFGIRDERSLRIGTYGLSYSWYLSFLTVAAIGWLVGTDMIQISGSQICLLLIILMPVSALIFQWYFNTHGDVY